MLRLVNHEGGDVINFAAARPASPATVLSLKEIGKSPKEWRLTLHPGHLALAQSPEERPYVILRDQVMKSATLIEGMRVLALNQPLKLSFKLTQEAAATLADWVGKPVLAAYYLKRRYAWVLPVAVLWLLGSLPLGGDRQAGVEAVPVDWFGLVLGFILVASWALARWRPHPALFLLDTLWFAAMGAHLVLSVLGGRSKGWLVLVLMLFWLVATGLKHFVRFRGTRIPRPIKPAR